MLAAKSVRAHEVDYAVAATKEYPHFSLLGICSFWLESVLDW
jgi:hypothetical protein